MKLIHNAYLFTEKDGVPEKIVKEAASLPNDYPAFIVSSDLAFLEKSIHAFAMSDLSPQRTLLYKIDIAENEYIAFLHPENKSFEQLHDSYSESKSESDKAKILSDMLGFMNDCIAVFSSLPKKKIEGMMKKIADQEETQHPAMSIPLRFTFTSPPFKASASLTEEFQGKPYYRKVIQDFFIHSKEWLSANNNLVMELLRLCSTTHPDPTDPRRVIAENIKITNDVENLYLGKAVDNQDYLKRIKILAAVNAYMMNDMLIMAYKAQDIAKVADYTFFLTRSMIQFSANKAVDAGLLRHSSQKEGGEALADRKGLLELIGKYDRQYPKHTNQELWQTIKNDLKRKISRPFKGYAIHFYTEPTDSSDTAGELIQRKKGKNSFSIKFETFEDYRKEVRK